MALRLNEFDPSRIKSNSTILIIGKRGSGKTVLMKDIAYNLSKNRKIDMAVGFSATEDSNKNLSAFIPSSLIHKRYKPEVVQKIYSMQQKHSKKGRMQNVALILDDVLYEKGQFNNDLIRKIFFNGRHYNLMVMLLAQYSMDLNPSLRGNVDLVFVARDLVFANRERLYKNFFGIFPTFSAFDKVMQKVTQNYTFLVLVNNDARSTKPEDVLFYYRAKDDLPEFGLGKKIYFKYDDRVGKKEEDEPESATGFNKSTKIILEGKKRRSRMSMAFTRK